MNETKFDTDVLRREFDAPGIHLGFEYRSPAIINGETDPGPAGASHVWTQSSVPGARAPHAWLSPGHSTLDLFGRGFTLLSFHVENGADNFSLACRRKNVPLNHHLIASEHVARLYEKAQVLVRPDRHVAWRGDTLPADPGALVDKVRGALA